MAADPGERTWWAEKRALITGSAGFVGTALSRDLRIAEANVTGVDKKRAGDVTNKDGMARVLDFAKPDVVFHLAAETEVLRSYAEPYKTFHTNVVGTLTMLELCAERKIRLVVASSDKAYGRAHPPYLESTNLERSIDPYGNSKKMADELCFQYHLLGHDVHVLRCANTYGPGQKNETTLITSVVKRLMRGEAPIIHRSHTDTKREWLYIDDAVKAYMAVAQHAKRWEYAYNVGSGETATPEEMVDMISRAMFGENKGYVIDSNTQRPQVGDQWMHSDLFNMRFKSWDFVPLKEGIRRTLMYYGALSA